MEKRSSKITCIGFSLALHCRLHVTFKFWLEFLKRLLRRRRNKESSNIKTDREQIGCEDADCFNLTQKTDQ